MRDLDSRALLIAAIAGLVLGFILCGIIAFLLPPIPADAADVGLFTTSATGSLTNCTQITSPVAFQTWCFDRTGELRVFTGNNNGGWATISVAPIIATRTLVATSVPTCVNNCGTSPSVTGTMPAFRVTIGSTGFPRSPFLVLFGQTLVAAPSCIAQLQTATGTTATVANSSTTGVSVNTVLGPAQGDVYAIQCFGVQ